jgi:hypothetical protein
MIGPAEIEDMLLDIAAAERQARLYDAAMAPLNRHWARRGAASAGSVSRICAFVHAKAGEGSGDGWREVASKATAEAGYRLDWNGDEVAALEAAGHAAA